MPTTNIDGKLVADLDEIHSEARELWGHLRDLEHAVSSSNELFETAHATQEEAFALIQRLRKAYFDAGELSEQYREADGRAERAGEDLEALEQNKFEPEDLLPTLTAALDDLERGLYTVPETRQRLRREIEQFTKEVWHLVDH